MLHKIWISCLWGFSADDLLGVQEVDTEMQDLVCQANDYATMKEDIMQLHQHDSANWEEELLNTQPTSSTPATPDEEPGALFTKGLNLRFA